MIFGFSIPFFASWYQLYVFPFHDRDFSVQLRLTRMSSGKRVQHRFAGSIRYSFCSIDVNFSCLIQSFNLVFKFNVCVCAMSLWFVMMRHLHLHCIPMLPSDPYESFYWSLCCGSRMYALRTLGHRLERRAQQKQCCAWLLLP